MSHSSTSSNSVAVYSARARLGSVERRGDDFIAIDVDGVVVGRFSNLRNAVRAFEETAS